MNINFSTQLLGPNGEIIPASPDPDAQPMTLKDVCMTALLTQMQGDAETKGQAYRLYTLANQVKVDGMVNLTAFDVALVKERIERIYPPWIVGQAWDQLDPPPPPPEAA